MKVTYVQHCGNDLAVVNAARVSFAAESDWEYKEVERKGYDGEWYTYNDDPHLSKRDQKLINYLAEHKHYSPFNHTFITMHVKAPLFVARQLV